MNDSNLPRRVIQPPPTGDIKLLEMTGSKLPKLRQGNLPLALVPETMGVRQAAGLESHSENLWQCKESWGQCLASTRPSRKYQKEGGREIPGREEKHGTLSVQHT